ncbi:hypothetical protein GGF46_001822 [Coemansia sp. RSA 552]|nr:hypothetical protein GGF46_001822 [Coemansia sp. RSA 552]
MEKAVFKATRKDAVHPKQKHVDTLIQMTLSGASMEELFMLVQDRFSEANWVISFKALILVHILMHEGNGATMYDFLIRRPNVLDMTRFRDRHGTKGVSEFEQSKNVRTYAAYLNDKVLAYKAIRIDHVTQRNPVGSQIFMKQPTDIKFMLLEVSTVQKQLHSVLKNRFDSDTLDNETTFSSFRYCLRDMLKLFQVMNFGVMKMLKVYFDMAEDDMRRALDLYKRFVKLTDRTDEYLKIARQFESIFGFNIPNLNHAPLSLSRALEDFLNMPVEERQEMIHAMKRTPKETKSSRWGPASESALGDGSAKMGPNGRPKRDYGLRLKPELLALSDDSPPSSASGAAKPAQPRRDGASAARAIPAASTTTLDQPTTSSSHAEDSSNKPATKEIDFIDFFSSIDDETTTVAANPVVPAVGGGGGMSAGTNANAGIGTAAAAATGQVQQNAATDFDAMFLALSNPFASANNSNNNNNNGGGLGALAAQQVQQQNQSQTQLVTASSASASPFSALGSAGMATTQQQQQPQPFNAFSGVGDISFASPAQPMTAFQTPQMQQGGGNGGFMADATANNPFRQSMFPTQSDLDSQQAMVASQMAQLSLQQQQLQQQLQQQQQQQQQQQASTNPFAQRQTMYMMGTSPGMQPQQGVAAGHLFGNSGATQFSSNTYQASATEQSTQFSAATSNVGSIQPQQQPVSSAQNMHAAINNGNFANFDLFK